MKKILPLSSLLLCMFFSHAQPGQLDPAFGNKGIVQTNIGAVYKYPSYTKQVLLQGNGSMYINLYGFNGATVLKRNSAGAVDSSFGINGFSTSPVSFVESVVALQPDGNLVIAGTTNLNAAGMIRIKQNGTPDSIFGTNGFLPLSFIPRAVVAYPDGKIVVAGSANDEGFIVQRHLSNGLSDNSFNGTGQAIIPFEYTLYSPDETQPPATANSGTANALAIQADGKIVVAGFAYTESGHVFAIARCNINGSPDSSFDVDGKQTTVVGSYNNVGYSVAIQADGKIILGGYSFDGDLNKFTLIRYTTNGGLDNTFSTDGIQTANVGSDMQVGNTVAIQSNGSILIAGYTYNGTDNDLAVARFTSNGNADNTFDGDGILITDITTSDDYAGGLAIQPDNKIIVAGYAFTDGVPTNVLVRYLPNGSLDNSFDTDGKLVGNINQGYTNYMCTAVQPDGKIVTGGMAWNGIDYDFAIARYNTNGSLDNGFGIAGKQITDFGTNDEANALSIQPDGKIILAGSSNAQFAIARYSANGILDASFSGDGKLMVPVDLYDVGKAVAIQPDGKIVVAGFSFTDPNFDSAYFAVARINTDGTPDNTFSSDGKLLTNFNNSPSFATSAHVQADGKIVVSGRSYINGQNNFAIARYNPNGTPDNTFSSDGKQNTTFGSDDYFGEASALQPDGKILVAGYSQSLYGESAFAIARYNNNGDLDNSFSNDGYQSTPTATSFNAAICISISNGRIALGGTNDNFALVLYKSNGNLDSSFNGNGIQSTRLGFGNSSIRGVAFAGNFLYAAGIGEFPGSMGVLARYLLADPAPGPLPVTIVDFEGDLQGKSVALRWHTLNAQSLSRFDVERSTDATNFTTIAEVNTKGNGNGKPHYTTRDNQPYDGLNYYRLKIMDKDGKFFYSNVISVMVNNGSLLWSIFPNPASDVIYLSSLKNNEKATVRVIDENGMQLLQVPVQLKNNQSLSVDIRSLSKGLYFLELRTKTSTRVMPFIKQ